MVQKIPSETNADGRVTLIPKSEGTTTIHLTAKSDKAFTRDVAITVEKPKVDSVKLWIYNAAISVYSEDTPDVAIYDDRETDVEAIIYDQFDEVLNSERVRWTVDDPNILEVKPILNAGRNWAVITPKATGQTTIHVTSPSDETFVKDISVTVVKQIPQSLRISSPTGFALGSTDIISANARDQFGNYLEYPNLKWTVTNSSVLALSGYEGETVAVIPKAEGTTTIYVESTGNPKLSHEVTVSVEEPILTSITQSYPRYIQLGWSYSHKYNVYDQFGNVMPLEQVVLRTDNPSVVNISNTEPMPDEYVYFVGERIGTATITVTSKTDPTITSTWHVTVESGSNDNDAFEQDTTLSRIQVSGTEYLAPQSSGSIFVYAYNQYGYGIPDSFTLSVDEPDILSLSKTEVTTIATALYPTTTPTQTDSSNQPEHIELSNEVTITAKAEGTATIHVVSKTNPAIKSDFVITVAEPVATSLEIATSSIISLDSTPSIRAYIYDQFGRSIQSELVTFHVADESILTIEDNTIVPKTVGTTTIRAESAGLTKEIEVTVTASIPVDILLMEESGFDQVLPSALYENYLLPPSIEEKTTIIGYVRGQYTSPLHYNLTWETSNESVFKLSTSETQYDETITLTPVNTGTAVLTVSCDIDEDIKLTKKMLIRVTKIEEIQPPIQINTLHLNDGWNFISIPKTLNTSQNTAGQLFGEIDTGDRAILGYDGEKQDWIQIYKDTVITPMTGYWIYSVSEHDISLSYSSTPTAPATKAVYPGWNAVGINADSPTKAANAFAGVSWKTALPWNISEKKFDTAILFDGIDESAPTNYLNIGVGIWFYSEEQTTLTGLTA